MSSLLCVTTDVGVDIRIIRTQKRAWLNMITFLKGRIEETTMGIWKYIRLSETGMTFQRKKKNRHKV